MGAFDQDVLVEARYLPGYRDGKPYLHSHMLAVLPEYRNAGLGRRLKLAQRDDALARGFDRMEWTFDPLEIKNAYLNIARLGAIVRHYMTRLLHGPTTSPLQGGAADRPPGGGVVATVGPGGASFWAGTGRRCGGAAMPQFPMRFLSESTSRTRSTTGNETRSSVSWLSSFRPVSGLCSNRRSNAGWPLPATNAPRREMDAFCWGR